MSSRSKTPGVSHERHPSAEPLRRSRTPLSFDEGSPWQQTVNTYTWVMEQQYAEIRKREAAIRMATVETRIIEPEWQEKEPERWNEKAHDIDMQARIWMLQEEARRIAALREAERTRLVQEEVKRIQARINLRRYNERQRILEERRQAYEDSREQERRKRLMAERSLINAWHNYEARWSSITSSQETLDFHTIPWPMLTPPVTPASINLAAISYFLLSPLHSAKKSTKERIKEALRRWHPDRFGRLLSRVRESDRAAVEEGVGMIARYLNELLGRQALQGRPVSTSIL